MLVGGVDLEMTQPRLNEAVLRRLAAESNGRYLPRGSGGRLPSLLRESRAEARHARDARPLAQWVEPAGDRRTAGRRVGCPRDRVRLSVIRRLNEDLVFR